METRPGRFHRPFYPVWGSSIFPTMGIALCEAELKRLPGAHDPKLPVALAGFRPVFRIRLRGTSPFSDKISPQSRVARA
ncbi:MAG: hypothetical protein A3K46_08690 [Chloroflexi bacterium RBG_13_60_9]|nr:MAG: hypothetical protein A3K46_08690 [Chloroflexi bacterium RBG_13_60_9]